MSKPSTGNSVSDPSNSPPRSLVEQLDRTLESGRGGLRFVDRAERFATFPWEKIAERASRAAGGLQRLGVEPGDRVAIIFPTSIEFFEAFFGAWLAGAVPVPLYPPFRLGRLDEYHERTAKMVAVAEVRLVLADAGVRRLLGRTLERMEAPPRCLTVRELPAGVAARPAPAGPEELALVQFSSGTTVDPKPVALSHGALLSQVRLLNDYWRDQPDANGVSWLPLYHDMGLIGCVLAALEYPAFLTLIPPELFVTNPAIWLRTISTVRATISPAPNFAYGLCLQKVQDEDLEGVDLSCWQVALNGAEAVSADVLRKFAERFGKFGFRAEALTPVYGLSEATLAVTFSDPNSEFVSEKFDRDALAGQGRAIRHPDGVELVSVGKPLRGFDVQIRDREGKVVSDGQVGRIWVRGPSLMTGYFRRPEATAKALRDGWLDTGDLGFLRNGQLYLSGRERDLIVLRGRNYVPDDIEQALEGLTGVREGCVAAVSHLPEGGEREELLLFVERAQSPRPDDELVASCETRLLERVGLLPDRVIPIAAGTLPRTSSGKIRRAEALRRHLLQSLDAPDSVRPWKLGWELFRSRRAMSRVKKQN